MCRRRDDDAPQCGGNAQIPTIVLGLSLGLSVIFLLVAGIKYANWLPMINFCFVVALPIAVIISEGKIGGIKTIFVAVREGQRKVRHLEYYPCGRMLLSAHIAANYF